MKKSLVVELWARSSGVVGIYRVNMRRSFADLLAGRWNVAGVDVLEGEQSSEATATVAVMVGHGLAEMNGWLARVL